MTDGRLAALGAAALFGSSTPAAKRLVGAVDPIVLAGLFYAGSAVALAVARSAIGARSIRPARGELARLAGAIACGGVLAPLALFSGLTAVSATAASLLLASETTFTATFAAIAFGERLGPRLVLAVVLMTVGAALVGWQGEITGEGFGAAAVVLASALWALDNNLTRDVRSLDATAVAMWKAVAAAAVDGALAVAFGRSLPPAPVLLGAALAGAAGYGASLVLFVIALRSIGAARTGAVFATGPAFGAALGVLWLGEPVTTRLVVAGAMLVIGLVILFRDDSR